MEDKDYTIEEEKKFIQGFNQGYLLQEKKPDLLTTLLQGVTSGRTPQLDGVMAGSAQREKEMNREYSRSIIERKNINPIQSKGMDRTDD